MKKWFQSKTIVVNVLAAVVAVVGAAMGTDLIAEYPQMVAVMAAVVSAANVALRFVTDLPIGSE
jgi:hypothetical protein